MKNRALLISLSVMLAISLSLTGSCGVVQKIPPDEVIVGVARDTDEALAFLEEMGAGSLMRIFVDYVNNVHGGVHLSEYDQGNMQCWVPLSIDFREIDVAVWDVAVVTEGICRDINNGDIHFLWGGPGTDCIQTQAAVADAYEVVLLTLEGHASAMIWDEQIDEYPYVFVTEGAADWYQLPVLVEILATAGATTAYICWQDTMYGVDYYSLADIAFPDAGITIVGKAVIPFDPAMAEIAAESIIAEAKFLDADVFCAFGYPDQVKALTEQAVVQIFNPDACVAGLGGNFGWFKEWLATTSSGPPPNGREVICFATANANTSPEMAWLFNNVLEPQLGFDGLDFWGYPLYWAALQMWLNALQEVGYVDQGLLRAELASYNSYANGVDTVLGRTWYTMFGNGGGILAYEYITGEIGQWQGGYVEIVGGAHTTSTLRYPKIIF